MTERNVFLGRPCTAVKPLRNTYLTTAFYKIMKYISCELEPHSHKWGQITLNISSLSPKRDWGPKRVKLTNHHYYGPRLRASHEDAGQVAGSLPLRPSVDSLLRSHTPPEARQGARNYNRGAVREHRNFKQRETKSEPD